MLVLIITGSLFSHSLDILLKKKCCVNYRERKIFPLALINYITLSGGGFTRENGVKLKNYTMDELIHAVRLVLNHLLNPF